MRSMVSLLFSFHFRQPLVYESVEEHVLTSHSRPNHPIKSLRNSYSGLIFFR
jgi:hypothetical protein